MNSQRESHRKEDGEHRKYYRKKKGRRILPLIIFLLFLVVAGAIGFTVWNVYEGKKEIPPRESSVSIPKETLPDLTLQKDAASVVHTPESMLETMTLEEKVLQMFMVTPEGITGVSEVYAAGEKTRTAINQYPVGGMVYFRGNLKTPSQTKDMIYRTQLYSEERSGIPMFIGVDEEGGTVTRIGGREEFSVPAIGNMSEIGASGDPQKAYEAGKTIGGYLSELGFNLDFAPVADAVTNPENTVVEKRAFGTEGSKVAPFSDAVVKGLQEQGVSASLKHFPGHGGTAGDTHQGYAYTEKTLDELLANELLPFQSGIQAGVHFVMVAHIAAPKVTESQIPSTFSKTMVTEVLRNRLGFQGIIITDAMNMKAITDTYSSGEAAVKAVEAGVDMILMPDNLKDAYEGLLGAVKSGQISQERIDQSVLRILKLKMGDGR